MERCKNGCEGKSWKWVIYEGYTGDMGYRDIWDLGNIWNIALEKVEMILLPTCHIK